MKAIAGENFRELYGIKTNADADKLAERINKSRGTIWNYCKASYPTKEMFELIQEDFPNLNMNWFIFNLGAKNLELDPEPPKSEFDKFKEEVKSQMGLLQEKLLLHDTLLSNINSTLGKLNGNSTGKETTEIEIVTNILKNVS
ncbi:hypothetical protein [Flammeovirga aprica]|uniref:Uncharacterized protein n=1 Tax=Flammeovirga aprica JL-4 TaxID=694437 RepID=A0A7X9P090_9BACT|nr:hypothetical protein [Flammeovirga aprica]NME67181.1 hypothetical protein [Flammeovirga aprica JL-4]